MSEELKPLPCPFCRHVGLGFSCGDTFRWLKYECQCGIGSQIRYTLGSDGVDVEETQRRAVEEWNTRAEPVRKVRLPLPMDGSGMLYFEDVIAALKAAGIEVTNE